MKSCLIWWVVLDLYWLQGNGLTPRPPFTPLSLRSLRHSSCIRKPRVSLAVHGGTSRAITPQYRGHSPCIRMARASSDSLRSSSPVAPLTIVRFAPQAFALHSQASRPCPPTAPFSKYKGTKANTVRYAHIGASHSYALTQGVSNLNKEKIQWKD
jgi:hypothetical protein